MAAVQETIDQVRQIDVDQYKYGFETMIEVDKAPKGKIGSLLPGKCADIVAVELSQLNTLPCFDPIAALVYSAGRNLVSHVWVNGELLVDDRQFSRLDERALKINAHIWQNRIRPSLPHQ